MIRAQSIKLERSTLPLPPHETASVIAFLEACPDICIGITRHLKIVIFNGAAESFTGIARSDIIGTRGLEMLIPVRIRECILELIENALNGTRRNHFECPIISSLGNEKIVSWSLVTLQDPLGAINTLVGIGRDVTEERIIQRGLEESEARFRRLTDQAPDIIFRWSWENGFEYINSIVEKITGYSVEDCYSEPSLLYKMVYPGDLQSLIEFMDKLSKGIQPTPLLLRYLSKIGKLTWLEQRVVPVLNSGNKAIAIEGIIRDVTEQESQRQQLEYLSYHDGLTGLLNKRAFDEKLSVLQLRGIRPVTVMVADLDKFKLINDNFGHEAGDKLLKATASKLMDSMPSDALLARIGGDEFTAVFVDCDEAKAALIAEKLNNDAGYVKLPSFPDDFPKTTISYGFHTANDLHVTLSQCLTEADKAMYRSKYSRTGRDSSF